MIFVGKTTDKGISTEAFEISSPKFATYLKVFGANEFLPITSGMEIVNASGERVWLEDMKADETYSCKVDGKTYTIDGNLFSQVVFMKQAKEGEKGEYLRCDDGLHIKATELQPQAYKALNVPFDHLLTANDVQGKKYAYVETVTFPDGTGIKLPNDAVKHIGSKWFYETDEGEQVEVKYSATKVEVDKFLVGDKIINADKLIFKEGKYYIDSGRGSANVEIGEAKIELKQPFFEGASSTRTEMNLESHNNSRQRPLLKKEGQRLVYTYLEKFPGPNGLLRIEINADRTIARFIYSDKHEEIYAKFGTSPRIKKDVETKVFNVRDFVISDMGDEGVKFEFYGEQVQTFVRDIKIVDNKITSYNINDNNITDIVWENDQIKSYKFNGVQLKDIVWKDDQIASCTIMVEKDGELVEEHISNMSRSKYNIYAITYKFTRTLENVVWDTYGVKSFTLGEHKFEDVKWNEDNTIKTCKLDGKLTDIENDSRFEQLKFQISNALKEANISPLIYTKAIEKVDGKYETKADYIQTSEAERGVAQATKIENTTDAMRCIKEFKGNPRETVYVDEAGRVHPITDIATTYVEDKDFEYIKDQNDTLNQILGKYPITWEKGDIKIKPGKAEDFICDRVAGIGAALCLTGIGIPIGAIVLGFAAVTKVAGGISRNIKKRSLKKQSLETITKDIQKDVTVKFEENINKLVKQYKRALKDAKKNYSQIEYEKFAQSLKEEFRTDFLKEVGSLQLLEQGTLKCTFDMGARKGKINASNYLAYLQCINKREELLNGKKDNPNLVSLLARVELNKDLNEDEKLIRRVELMKQYGGKHTQERAYQLQRDNAEIFIEYEDIEFSTYDKEKRDIMREQYLQKISSEFNRGKNQWGDIKDKQEYMMMYDHKYAKADDATRKKMLKDLRDKIEHEAKTVKVTEVSFTTSLDGKGNSLAEEYIMDALTYMEMILPMFNGDSTKVGDFVLGMRKNMSQAQLDSYEPTSFKDGFTKRDNNDFTEKLVKAEAKTQEEYSQVQARCNEFASIAKKLESAEQSVKASKDYVKALECDVKMKRRSAEYKQVSDDIVAQIDGVANSELDRQKYNELNGSLQHSTTKMALHMDNVARLEQKLRADYEEEVEYKAKQEFLASHKKEYDKFVENRKKTIETLGADKQTDLLDAERLEEDFIESITKVAPAKTKLSGDIDLAKVKEERLAQERAINNANELEFLKVKNDEKAKIEAFALCEMEEAELEGITGYKDFIEERNKEREQKGIQQLDINSEYAKLYYYTAVKHGKGKTLEKVKESEKFNETFLQKAERYFDEKKQQKKQQKDKSRVSGKETTETNEADLDNTADTEEEVEEVGHTA